MQFQQQFHIFEQHKLILPLHHKFPAIFHFPNVSNAIYFLHFYNILHALFPFQKEQKNESVFVLIVVLFFSVLQKYFLFQHIIFLHFVATVKVFVLFLFAVFQNLVFVLKAPHYVSDVYEFGLLNILFLKKAVFFFAQTVPVKTVFDSYHLLLLY